MYDLNVSRRRRYGSHHPSFSSVWGDYGGYGGFGNTYSAYGGMLDPTPSFGYVIGSEIPNSVEDATRAHMEAKIEHEKAKEKYEEAKKKYEDCEKKVKEAELRLNWAKGVGGYR